MTRISPEALYELLPAVYRMRDADEGLPLKALVAVLAREGAVLEENIEQLLDDLFIETCAPWTTTYVGGVIGYRPLFEVEGLAAGSRAEVANTIGYRRRKGTAAVLEQLARDVTGWPARVVEYFQLTATCQHMNHIRLAHWLAPDLRDPLTLEPLGRAFDGITRSVDVRSITQGPGRAGVGGVHNLPNIGLHLWRLQAHGLHDAPTTQIDPRRYLFDPLGVSRALVNDAVAEAGIAALAQPVNVPGAITRRMLAADPGLWYGRDGDGSLRAFEITVDGVAVTDFEACDLSDDGAGWNHVGPLPPVSGLVRIDPELGRIAFPVAVVGEVRTTFHTAFPASIGGGEYGRAARQTAGSGAVTAFPNPLHPTLQDALDALQPAGGIVEITTNDVFDAPLIITAAAGAEVGLRAAPRVRPVLRATQPIVLSGGTDARLSLDGVVIDGAQVQIAPDGSGASPATVDLTHVTLIPGLGFDAAGGPATPDAVSLEITTTGVEVTLTRSITGPLRISDTTNLSIEDSIVDAAAANAIDSAEGLALAGLGGDGDAAGAVNIATSTLIGRVQVRSFGLVTDSILLARDPGDGSAPVRALRRQEGCLRFSFVPDGSVVPRRYRCQPQLAIERAVAAREDETGTEATAAEQALIARRIRRWLRPSFTSLRASAPAYGQLRQAAPVEIRNGASDEGEMGAYHLLFQPQREANLRIRLEEYLRFGLEAGLFFET